MITALIAKIGLSNLIAVATFVILAIVGVVCYVSQNAQIGKLSSALKVAELELRDARTALKVCNTRLELTVKQADEIQTKLKEMDDRYAKASKSLHAKAVKLDSVAKQSKSTDQFIDELRKSEGGENE